MSELLAMPGFDDRAKRFLSVSITAVEAAELRLGLAVVTAENIARGLTPARYVESYGQLGKVLFLSSGLQMGNVVSEYLVWREIARALDDNGSPSTTDAGRWSQHIPPSELKEANVCIRHECCASMIRIRHHVSARRFGEVEFDESRLVPKSARQPLAVALQSRRERWCAAFGDALACPNHYAQYSPQLFRIVRFALKIDLNLDLQLS